MIFTWVVAMVSLKAVEFLHHSYNFSPLHLQSYLKPCSIKHKKISLYTRYPARITHFRHELTREILVTHWWTRISHQKHVLLTWFVSSAVIVIFLWISYVTTSYQLVLRLCDFQDETHTRYSHDALTSFHSQRSNFSIFHIISVPCIFQVIFICVQEITRKSHYVLVIQRAKLVSGKGQLVTSWLQTSELVTRIKNTYFCFWRGLYGSQR